jgi:hypothetical protein
MITYAPCRTGSGGDGIKPRSAPPSSPLDDLLQGRSAIAPPDLRHIQLLHTLAAQMTSFRPSDWALMPWAPGAHGATLRWLSQDRL